MYAMVVTVDIDAARADDAVKLLKEFTIPTVKAQAGFVRGAWLRSDDSSHGRGVVLFDTKEHASEAAGHAEQGPPPGAPVTIQSVETFEVIGEA